MSIGAIFGSASAGVAQDRVGRRMTVIIACLVYLVGATVEVRAVSYGMLLSGRLVVGLAIGVFASTGPLFISEISPPSIRGQLVTANQLNVCIGILGGYIVNRYLPGWRYQLGFGIPFAAVLCFCFAFITPFSPRWLVAQHRCVGYCRRNGFNCT